MDRPVLIVDSITVASEFVQGTNSDRGRYRGYDNKAGRFCFEFFKAYGGTNNVYEFLAVTHALAFAHKEGTAKVVYTSSQTAIAWIKNGEPNSQHKFVGPKEKQISELLVRAIKWLQEHPDHIEVRKWESKIWGVNPAKYKELDQYANQ